MESGIISAQFRCGENYVPLRGACLAAALCMRHARTFSCCAPAYTRCFCCGATATQGALLPVLHVHVARHAARTQRLRRGGFVKQQQQLPAGMPGCRWRVPPAFAVYRAHFARDAFTAALHALRLALRCVAFYLALKIQAVLLLADSPLDAPRATSRSAAAAHALLYAMPHASCEEQLFLSDCCARIRL